MIISSTHHIVYKHVYLCSRNWNLIFIKFTSDITTVLWGKKLLQKKFLFYDGFYLFIYLFNYLFIYIKICLKLKNLQKHSIHIYINIDRQIG